MNELDREELKLALGIAFKAFEKDELMQRAEKQIVIAINECFARHKPYPKKE